MSGKYIILGDVHLGKGLKMGKPGDNGELNSRIKDQIRLLDWTLDRALEHKAETIFVTGDVYEDPRPVPALIRIFMEWVKKCEKSGVAVHVLMGNHDLIKSGAYTVSALDIIPAVELPSTKVYKNVETLHFDKVSFTLVPYRDRRLYDADTLTEGKKKLFAEFEKEHESVPDGNKKVLIGHLALEGSLYVGDEIEDMSNELFCSFDMFSNYDYVWMGHIHNPQVLQQKPRCAHVGSMDRSDFGANELKYDKIIILIDPDSEDFFKEIVIPTRNLRDVKVEVPDGKDTTDFIINHLHSYDKDNPLKDAIVRLTVELEGAEILNMNRKKVHEFILNNLGAHHICQTSESRNISVVPLKKTVKDEKTGENIEQDILIFSNDMNIKNVINTYIDALELSDDKDIESVREFMFDCIQETQK